MRLKQGWSQQVLAEKLGCDTKTVQRWEKDVLPQPYWRPKLADLFGLSLEEFGLVERVTEQEPERSLSQARRENLDEAPDISGFCGRGAECALLKDWIVTDRCRLLTILGMGGMGKTTLVAKTIELVRDDFTAVFWQTLKNAPPLASVLRSCLQFLAPTEYAEIPADEEKQVALLLHIFLEQRCLLILDNLEAILQPEQRTGLFLPGYEHYANFLQRVGATRHQSCLLLTSREKPAGLYQMEGQSAPVRSLLLSGMPASEGRALLKEKALQGEEEQWMELIQRYGGNPLALKLISETIREIFAGQIGDFLQQQTFALGNISDLLKQQFQRFSPQERELVAWLAIEREAVSLDMLRSHSLLFAPGAATIDALESLHHRSLIEKTESSEPSRRVRFFLQPVILEYATIDLVQRAWSEFITFTRAEEEGARLPASWQQFAFLLAQAVDYIREIQRRMLLEPLCALLLERYGQLGLEQQLLRLLQRARQAPSSQTYLAGNLLNMLVYLRGLHQQRAFPELRGLDFSHLSIRQAYLQDVHLPETNFEGASFRDTLFTGTLGVVSCVTFSPDGTLLAAGTAIGEIWLYDVASGVPRDTLRGHSDGVWSIAFSPDSRTLVSGSDDQTVRLWNVATGQCEALLNEHTNRVRAIAFSSDGALLASGSNDQHICVWETTTGRLLKTLRGHTYAIWSLAFHPSRPLLVSAGMDQSIRVWSLDAEPTSSACLSVLAEHSDRVRAIAFQRAGELLASASDDQTVRLWDIQQQTCLRVLRGHTNRAWSVAFHPDGTTLVSGSEDGTLRFWQTTTGECFRVLQAHHGGARSVAFSSDGKLLASGGEDQTFRLWDSRTGNSLKTVQGYVNRILSIDFTSQGQLISSDDNQELRLWDIASRQCIKTISTRGQGTRAIAASARGSMLASVGGDQKVHLWNLETGRAIATLPYHTNWGRAVTFSPDGKMLASGGEDKIVLLWQIQSNQKIRSLVAHRNWLRALAFSMDSTLLASGGDDLTIYLWDVASGACLKRLDGHSGAIRALAFHPTRPLLFSGSEDATLRCWDTETGACLSTLKGHTNRVLHVDVCPDGSSLASCSDDLSLCIWQLADATCHVISNAHARRIRGLTYAPDGKLLASCSDDGTIKLWETSTYDCVSTLIGERPYERMNITHVSGLTEAQRTTLHLLGAWEKENE